MTNGELADDDRQSELGTLLGAKRLDVRDRRRMTARYVVVVLSQVPAGTGGFCCTHVPRCSSTSGNGSPTLVPPVVFVFARPAPMRSPANVVPLDGIGRDVVRMLARRGYAIVVYLDDQRRAEATVEEVFATDGTAVAVRADVTDDLDGERLFDEAIAAFGGVDARVPNLGLRRRPFPQTAINIRKQRTSCDRRTPAETT